MTQRNGQYMHLDCLAVLFMYQGDPGGDERVPVPCSRCIQFGRKADVKKTLLLDGLFERLGMPH